MYHTPPVYHTPLVCRNGHIITYSLQDAPQHTEEKFCQTCGEPAFSVCPHCKARIRGAYERGEEGEDIFGDGGVNTYFSEPPRYCYHCGLSYPWTQRAIEKLDALAEDAANLSREERAELSAAVQDIVKDTARKGDAIDIFKRLFQKAGETFWEEAKDILARITAYCMKPGP